MDVERRCYCRLCRREVADCQGTLAMLSYRLSDCAIRNGLCKDPGNFYQIYLRPLAGRVTKFAVEHGVDPPGYPADVHTRAEYKMVTARCVTSLGKVMRVLAAEES